MRWWLHGGGFDGGGSHCDRIAGGPTHRVGFGASGGLGGGASDNGGSGSGKWQREVVVVLDVVVSFEQEVV